MNVIQCYAPSNDSNDDDKDRFFERLQSILAKCPGRDLTILIGGSNAKFEIDNIVYEDVMGRHELRGKNENGEKFKYLCAFYEMVICDTIFTHKRMYKAPWVSLDNNYRELR
ncbi:unnamed protein product [Schistosoma margrebowiei]|uniref:Uncharacterized protein n=1 Tax=Schistosoma margrebowiei TaxID=48269 RepID=A0A183N5M4_9TREM|nr:unnamed protein product [Schistosoma margrebowiei]